MVYDAALHEIVLFGGGPFSCCGGPYDDDTWVWDGTGWTELSPPQSPPPREGGGMAYDARHGVVVLFGGRGATSYFNDTWTFDGTTWTQQHPTTVPLARVDAGVTYDNATGKVIMFGGYQGCFHCDLNDTWTWNGTNWRKLRPANAPSPRDGMAVAYDRASHDIVLFGGTIYPTVNNQTWTFDGSNWTEQFPSTHPSARVGESMAYDAAREQVVLFSGGSVAGSYDDTWVWDGTIWANELPTAAPGPRLGAAMAYDAGERRVVMFGGALTDGNDYGDTWVWNGSKWHIPFNSQTTLAPDSGPAGATVKVTGSGFAGLERVKISFLDTSQGKTFIGTSQTDASGALDTTVTIPAGAAPGAQMIQAVGRASLQRARSTFTVTP
jgi:hypothetical protein